MYNIDVSKLKRDYSKNPLFISKNGIGSESPYKEDLEYLYLELNMTKEEIAEYLSITKGVVERRLKHFNINKPKDKVVLSSKNTKLERYGDENYRNNEKIIKTTIERYGHKHYSQTNEYKDKVKNTKLERYGNKNYNNIDKAKKTNKEKYGVEYTFSTDFVKDKIKKTNMEKYGVENHAQINLTKEMITMLSSKDNMKEFIENQPIKTYNYLSTIIGITPPNVRKHVVKYNLEDMITLETNESSYELELQKLFPNMIKHDRKTLDGKEIDLYDPAKKIGIEFNGDFYHNEYGKDKLYHQQKSNIAEIKGIFLYHIFEYDWIYKKEQTLNQLNNLLGNNETKIYARKCIIKDVNNCDKNKFLDANHMQGNDNSSIKLGLYYNDELVSLMTFVKPRFNKHYQWELSRFCSKAGCNVIGGASKLWKHFVYTYKPSSVISYSNIAHTKGNLYGMLGFTLQGISEPNYVWSNGNKPLTRYQCQKHKLLEQGYEGNSEIDIMHSRGYYRIYDCGNKVWVWKS